MDAISGLSSPRAHDRLRTLDTVLRPLHASAGVADLRSSLGATVPVVDRACVGLLNYARAEGSLRSREVRTQMAKTRRTSRRTPEWTNRDSALWYTCEIAAELSAGRIPQPQLEIVAPFPPRFHTEEQFWAAGPFQLFDYRAAGDGTYLHDTSFFFATGPAGIAFTLAAAAGRAIGNASRRQAAQAAASPCWTVIDQGTLYVTGHGFYLHTSTRLLTWVWSPITVASMVGPCSMQLQGNADSGRTVSWILQSDWSELVFITWAFARHPRHPQLIDGTWLPPGWMTWCASQRYPTRLTTPVLTEGSS